MREGLRPALYKTIQPPMNDMSFRSICANTETRVLFGHIRAASGTAIATINNHPFVFGRHGENILSQTNSALLSFSVLRAEEISIKQRCSAYR